MQDAVQFTAKALYIHPLLSHPCCAVFLCCQSSVQGAWCDRFGMRHSLQQAGFDKVHSALPGAVTGHCVCSSQSSVPEECKSSCGLLVFRNC